MGAECILLSFRLPRWCPEGQLCWVFHGPRARIHPPWAMDSLHDLRRGSRQQRLGGGGGRGRHPGVPTLSNIVQESASGSQVLPPLLTAGRLVQQVRRRWTQKHSCQNYNPRRGLFQVDTISVELFKRITNLVLTLKQVKPGFTNYQPRPKQSWAWSKTKASREGRRK